MNKKNSLEITRLSPDGEVASAKILFQEGLYDEAKKLLHQILIHSPRHGGARTLLNELLSKEQESLFRNSRPTHPSPSRKGENAADVIRDLSASLGIDLEPKDHDPRTENWCAQKSLDARERYDLGVAFFEMDCFQDALRELRLAEKAIRLQHTFLGPLGVSVVALQAECLIELGQNFQAKVHLEPVLSEPDLKLEEKLALFYVIGRAEENLSQPELARSWYKQIAKVDPSFRDIQTRLSQLG